MIRAVADRLVSRTRPAYVGRHRRTRPMLSRVLRPGSPLSEGLPDGEVEAAAGAASGRPCL